MGHEKIGKILDVSTDGVITTKKELGSCTILVEEISLELRHTYISVDVEEIYNVMVDQSDEIYMMPLGNSSKLLF
jgi:hypothetical protein